MLIVAFLTKSSHDLFLESFRFVRLEAVGLLHQADPNLSLDFKVL